MYCLTQNGKKYGHECGKQTKRLEYSHCASFPGIEVPTVTDSDIFCTFQLAL